MGAVFKLSLWLPRLGRSALFLILSTIVCLVSFIPPGESAKEGGGVRRGEMELGGRIGGLEVEC